MIHPEKISLLQRTRALVTDFAESIPPGLVKEKPSDIAFSIKEIIYHLLEVEHLWQRRLHQLLHTEDRHFQQIDPDALAKEGKYNEQSYQDGIAKWKAAREETVKLIGGMTDEQLQIKGIHSRYGEMDTHRIVEIIVDHDQQHLKQMERTLKQIKN